jgi:hypothetical protein
MTSLTIDPRNRPLRGIRAIAEYLGQDPQLTRRQLLRGSIDADRDGKLFVTTPARVDASPLIVGRSPSRSGCDPCH